MTSGLVIDALGTRRRVFARAEEDVAISVLVDPRTPAWLARAVREALVPERTSAHVSVRALGAAPVMPEGDACVVLSAGDVPQVGETAIPLCVLLPVTQVIASDDSSRVTLVPCVDARQVAPSLAAWLLAAVPHRELALAASFPFCRPAALRRIVARCARENAAVGALPLIPGADMPVMTANQLRMALEVLAAYGLGSSVREALALVGVVGAGLAYRQVARRLPKPTEPLGWALRGAVGYAGSVATGVALGHIVALMVQGAAKPQGIVSDEVRKRKAW